MPWKDAPFWAARLGEAGRHIWRGAVQTVPALPADIYAITDRDVDEPLRAASRRNLDNIGWRGNHLTSPLLASLTRRGSRLAPHPTNNNLACTAATVNIRHRHCGFRLLHMSSARASISASAGGKGEILTSAGWQIALCDSMWHVSFP